MSRLTTLGLLALVCVLAFVIWRQTETEDPELGVVEIPLLEDFQPRQVTAIRIDSIERVVQLGMERDPRGRWVIVDPIAYPARTSMVSQLLQALSGSAYRIPEGEEELARARLEKPRAFLEVTETLEDGDRRVRRIELGGIDVDGLLVHVRVDDQPLRAWRSLEGVLQISLNDWRSRAVFDLEPKGIVEVRRTGIDPQQSTARVLDFQARREGTGWWIERPVRLMGEPALLGIWSEVMAVAQVDRFVSDIPEADMARFGLDQPAFTMTLTDRHGREQTLEAGVPTIGSYFFRRSGSHHVWTLEERDFSELFVEPRDFHDPVLARVLRSEVEQVSLSGPQGEVRVRRELGGEAWRVSWRRPGEEAWTPELPAEGSTVERVLGTLEQREMIVDYFWEDPVSEHFPEGSAHHGVWLEAGGRRYGGRRGPVATTSEGTEIRPFWRERENRVAQVPLAVGELLEIPLEDFVSLLIQQHEESTLRTLEIGLAGGPMRSFERTVQTTWTYADVEMEATAEIFSVLDHLFHLVAESHVPEGEEAELLDVVSVGIEARDRTWHRFDVGRTAEGEVRARVGERQSILAHAPLHEDLLVIARKKR